jgi:hypothetical protein
MKSEGPAKLMMVVCLAIVLLPIARPIEAQQAAEPGVPVQMIVSVEPKKGDEIPMVTKHDIVIRQGKDVRPVTDWVQAAGDRAGLALAILIDDSAASSLGLQLNDIRNFIQEQPSTTLIALGYMQNGTVAVAHNFTPDHVAVTNSLRITQAFWGALASPYLSLSDFIKRWPSNPAIPRREVLMISSGIDTVYAGVYPNPYVDQAIRNAQCGGVVVYALYTPSAGHFGHSYWRTNWGQNYLGEIADATGGESYYFLGPQAPVSFGPYLQKLSHQLTNQFLMTFSAEPRKKAGVEPVKITTEVHDVDLIHAADVCVPASPGR